MTDPRIAALAEALHSTAPHNHNIGEGPQRAICHFVSPHTNRAAAILAALPPDWCGHAAYEAELERNWSRDRAALGATEARENECERELAMLLAVNHAHSAEITRLRAVEAAARDLIANTEVGAWPVSDALRAALEAER